jgi:hypothetical protein
MTDKMWELMDRLLHMQSPETGLVFMSRRGADYYGQLGYRWHYLMTRAGFMLMKDSGHLLPRFDFHSLRHVLGSVLLAQGRPMTFCARVLGHTKETFVKAYARELANQEGSTREALQLAAQVYDGEHIPLLEAPGETRGDDTDALPLISAQRKRNNGSGNG